MSLFEQDNGCCGARFNKNQISTLGLLTLSLPLIYISLIFIVLLFPITKIFKVDFRILSIVLKSNLKLVREQNIFSKTKCEMTSRLIPFSPLIAGKIFKFFNLIFLTSIWILLLLILFGVLIYE